MFLNRVIRSVVHCGKPLILILSGIAMFYLIVTTIKVGQLKPVDSRYRLNAEIPDPNQLPWDATTMELYREQLGVDQVRENDLTLRTNCGRILTAFAVDNLEDLIWQYISLISTEAVLQARGIKITAYLSAGSMYQLTSILKNVTLPSMQTLHPSCYNLSKAKILGSVNDIETDGDVDVPLILETSSRRIKEISSFLQTHTFKEHFEFRPNVSDSAERNVLYTQISMTSNEFENETPLVCIHVGRKRPSTGFYKRAMKVFDKFYISSNFLVLCPSIQLEACNEYFVEENQIVIEQSAYQPVDLAILSLCNHSVVSNTFGALGGLLSGGGAVVYDNQKDPLFNIAVFFAEGLSDWYPIA